MYTYSTRTVRWLVGWLVGLVSEYALVTGVPDENTGVGGEAPHLVTQLGLLHLVVDRNPRVTAEPGLEEKKKPQHNTAQHSTASQP